MTMKRNLLIIIFLAVAAFIYMSGPRPSIINQAGGGYSQASREAIKDVYDLSFVPTTVPFGNINTYLPQYSRGNDGRRNFYRDIFGMKGDFLESEDYFYLPDEIGTLYVHKFENLVRFNATPGQSESPLRLTDDEALSRAKEFMENNFLFSYYEEAKIFSDSDRTEVKFVNRIGNLKNYAFVNSITLDSAGNVTELEYYTTVYEKFTSVKIKSMSEAVYELPVDFPEGIRVDLKKCTLVYIYADSIVQPAYMFEGELSDGRLFKSFVKASLYS